MRYIKFKLSMPEVTSWNGTWSGSLNNYVIVRNFRKASDDIVNKILQKKYYSYSWSDGWRAEIEVEEVDSKKAIKERKGSDGFHGYDWMVDSIIKKQVIST